MADEESNQIEEHEEWRGPQLQAHRTTLRDNLESIAIALVLVLIVRQVVVEAFKIPTGSMAPALLGVHKEVRCPNCSWVFRLGQDSTTERGETTCPNCQWQWDGTSQVYQGNFCTDRLAFRRPAWLWHEGHSNRCEVTVTGNDAANRIDRGGSRIFVNKFIYSLRQPRRWEVVVFRYPFYKVQCKDCGWNNDVKEIEDLDCPICGGTSFEVERRDFIKRCVGLPNEKLYLQNGDLYVNGQIARKPPSIQDRMWIHVFDSHFMPKERVAPIWDFRDRSRLWKKGEVEGSLILDNLGSEQPVTAAFAREIKDEYAYNGPERAPTMPGFASRTHRVGDCRIRARVELIESGSSGKPRAILRIREGPRDFVLTIPAGDEDKLVLQEGSKTLEESPVQGLREGEPVQVALENYDDTVVVRLRGRIVMSHRYEGPGQPGMGRNSVEFGGSGSSLAFKHIVIERDIHYFDRNNLGRSPHIYDMGPGQYFMLGDNCPHSSDSRYWPEPYVPEENLIGEAFFVFWPIHEFRLLSLRTGH